MPLRPVATQAVMGAGPWAADTSAARWVAATSAEAWVGALAAGTSAMPWVAVASVAACAADTSAAIASPLGSRTGTVSAVWSYPSGIMTIGTAATAIMIRRL